jgi:hypothetical protein
MLPIIIMMLITSQAYAQGVCADPTWTGLDPCLCSIHNITQPNLGWPSWYYDLTMGGL